MSRIISTKEWDTLSHSLEARDQTKKEINASVISLIEAVEKRDKNEIERLIAEGAPLNMSLNGDVTPLVAAIENDDLDMVHFLISKGAIVTHKLTNGIDAAWIAMLNKNNKIFLELMKVGNVLINARKSDTAETRLIAATQVSNLIAVKLFLQSKVRINDYDSKGRTALHHNLLKTPYTEIDGEIGRLLLQFNGNPNQEDNEGITPAAFAETPEQLAILEGVDIAPITPEMLQKVKLVKNPPAPVEEDKIDFTGITAPRMTKALPKPRLPQKLGGRRKG